MAIGYKFKLTGIAIVRQFPSTTPLSMQVYTSFAVFLTTTLAIITAAHGVVIERAPVVGGPRCSNAQAAAERTLHVPIHIFRQSNASRLWNDKMKIMIKRKIRRGYYTSSSDLRTSCFTKIVGPHRLSSPSLDPDDAVVPSLNLRFTGMLLDTIAFASRKVISTSQWCVVRFLELKRCAT
ncbi:hypothetical protein BDN72DRAFT_858033 [Pluteus cervinus]|uniref:Uncharacterized protein n=1 Tax=Pluteus cervinus TaxID=181527 RepID=A0ACD3ASL7_9AGAR|nr:hypothetical protein BDN72DRAFT_858033 [Pluteus cervinus]